MKPESVSKTTQPQLNSMLMQGGKNFWPQPKKPISEEVKRKVDADAVVSAIADAARAIGKKGVAQDYAQYDFYLFPRHVAPLLPPDHPLRATLEAAGDRSEARVLVPWPWREAMEVKSTNEFREKPAEIIGLLMRRILDGDSAFFNALAQAVRDAKREAKRELKRIDPSNKAASGSRNRTRIGAVVAASLDGWRDSDWFSRIAKPARSGKAPYAVWELCKSHHDKGESPPTRLQVREHLKNANLRCPNMTVMLKRLNLSSLIEGGRPRKN